MKAILIATSILMCVNFVGCGHYPINVNSIGTPEIRDNVSFCIQKNELLKDDYLDREIHDKIQLSLIKWRWKVDCDDNNKLLLAYAYGVGQQSSIVGIIGSARQNATSGLYSKLLFLNNKMLPNHGAAWLRLEVVDGKSYADSGNIKTIWTSEVSTPDVTSLREVIDCLLDSAFRKFGRNSQCTLNYRSSCGGYAP